MNDDDMRGPTWKIGYNSLLACQNGMMFCLLRKRKLLIDETQPNFCHLAIIDKQNMIFN